MSRRVFGWVFAVAGAVVMPFWVVVGELGGVIAGAVVGVLGALALLGVDVPSWPGRYIAWARPRFIWWHQLVQLVVTAAGAALAYLVSGGWSSAVIVVAVSVLISLDAGIEGRHAERRRAGRPDLQRSSDDPECATADLRAGPVGS